MKHKSWPIGFSATGMAAGLALKKGKMDLALFHSHLPASGAGVFTKNLVKAAPIVVTHDNLVKSRGHVRTILVNSGSANAATGQKGIRDAKECVRFASKNLNVSGKEVWVSSTGVIGLGLNVKKYKSGLKKLIQKVNRDSVQEGHLAAKSILTTDTHTKIAQLTFKIHGVPVRIWGCAKGSGMIHPVLAGPSGKLHATMLSFILTDADIKPQPLQRTLEKVTDKTFNCVSIDGDTSTNDFVGVMANGASGSPSITIPVGKNYRTFSSALQEICERLTTEIALDGEGASRLAQIFVEGARTEKSARQMAATVASSPLFKTAIHGADPNWGRVLMAMGRSGVPFELSRVKIWLGDILVCSGGQEVRFSESNAIRYLKKKKIVVRIQLGLGKKWSRYKTCDFTGHYVGINAGYRT